MSVVFMLSYKEWEPEAHIEIVQIVLHTLKTMELSIIFLKMKHLKSKLLNDMSKFTQSSQSILIS